MTKTEIRELRKEELKELAVAFEIMQNYCNKYATEEMIDKKLSYTYNNATRVNVNNITTPSEVKKFLENISDWVNDIYYRK